MKLLDESKLGRKIYFGKGALMTTSKENEEEGQEEEDSLSPA